jgi:hypothetical protein
VNARDHYGSTVWSVYTLATQKINSSQNCRTIFSDSISSLIFLIYRLSPAVGTLRLNGLSGGLSIINWRSYFYNIFVRHFVVSAKWNSTSKRAYIAPTKTDSRLKRMTSCHVFTGRVLIIFSLKWFAFLMPVYYCLFSWQTRGNSVVLKYHKMIY